MERDVFNEKPTKEETMAAEQVCVLLVILNSFVEILNFFFTKNLEKKFASTVKSLWYKGVGVIPTAFRVKT